MLYFATDNANTRSSYRYLWIDSLCIIQDSKAHWDQESKIMGAVYGRADCTIAALSAINSHEGCFVDRNPLVSLPCFLKAGGKSWYIEGNPTIGVELRDSKLQPLPLHQRAWVVQERLLSPRTLYYGSFGLAWECVECSATESIPEGAVSRFSPKMSFFAIHQLPPDGNPELNGQKIYEEWLTAQIAYTRCSLTKFTDKLVAISGVINRIESITGWTNIFGLWKERFLVDLLWFLEEPSIRPPVNVAPSWSWASIEGRVMMATGPSEEVKFMAEVEAGAMPSQKSFGLQLKARVRQVTGRRGKLNPGSPGSPAPTWDEVDWDPDVFPDEAWEMWCMLIARLPSYLGGEEVFDVGLVLTPEMGKWKRIGLWRQMHTVGNSVLFPIEDDYELTEVVVI